MQTAAALWMQKSLTPVGATLRAAWHACDAAAAHGSGAYLLPSATCPCRNPPATTLCTAFRLLGLNVSKKEVEALLLEVDKDGSGEVRCVYSCTQILVPPLAVLPLQAICWPWGLTAVLLLQPLIKIRWSSGNS